MKRLIIALGIVLASAAALSAQEVVTPQYEFGLNYSWLHVNGVNGDLHRTGNGGSGYFEYNIDKIVGLVGDFGGYANTRINQRLFTYMFGPRFNWRHARWNPYVQFLFGGADAWLNVNSPHGPTQNAFAMAAGGGLDYALTRRIALKPFQAEYVMTELQANNGFGSRQNDVRFSAGVAFRFGEK